MITLQELTNFVLKHDDFNEQSKKELELYFKLKIKYGQLFILWDKEKLIALVEWKAKKEIAEIQHITIHKEHRNQGLVKRILWEAKIVYPSFIKIEFKREKYNDRKSTINIRR